MLVKVSCFKPSPFPLLPEVTIKNEDGVFVRDVPEDGVFAAAGVSDGFVIVSVNNLSFLQISSADMFRFLAQLQGDINIVLRSPSDKPSGMEGANNGNKGRKSTTATEEGGKLDRKHLKRKVTEASKTTSKTETVIPDVKSESCPNCDQKFSSISAVSSHFTDVHKSSKTTLPPKQNNPMPADEEKVLVKEEKVALGNTQQDSSSLKLQRENQVLKRKIERLNKEVESFRKNKEAINLQIKEVTEKYGDIEENVKIKQKIIDQLIQDQACFAEEKETSAAEKNAMETLIADQAKELVDVKQHFKSKIEEMASEMNTFKTMNEDIQAKLDMNEDYKETITKLETGLREKDEKIKKYKDKFLKVSKELKDLQESHGNLTQGVTGSDADKEEINRLSVQLANEIEISKELQATIDKINQRNNKLESDLLNTEENKAKILSTVAELQDQIKKNEKNLEEVVSKAECGGQELEEKVCSLNTIIEDLRKQNGEWEHAMDREKSNVVEKDETIRELTENNSKLNQQYEKDKKIKNSLTNEIEDLRSKLKDISSDKTVTNQIEIEMMKNLEVENKILQDKLNKKDATEAQLMEQNNELDLKNIDLERRMSNFDDFTREWTHFMKKQRQNEKFLGEKSESSFRKPYPFSDRRSYYHQDRNLKRNQRFEDEEERRDYDYKRPRESHSPDTRSRLGSCSPEERRDESSTSRAEQGDTRRHGGGAQ